MRDQSVLACEGFHLKTIRMIVCRPLITGRVTLKIQVHITLKLGVLDPQGKAIERTLGNLGFEGVHEVRQGKFIEIDIAETNPELAKEAADQMCRKLLANTVIEDYRIDIGR
jgi:phosphoribosylformylglycinamidine synthase PurS subunit